ncbi:uncharacterized protein [Dysidea avara]|uniref:uncharacterized protein n=1 Tax=Dysidea avara TaxID=196820 RepID=UPI00331F1131
MYNLATLSPSENTNGGILQTLAEEQDVIRDTLSELSSKVDELCSLNQNLESEIKATADTVISKPPSVVDSLLSTSPVEVVDEYLDRKCNLVIYNLPEPSASATKDRTQQDKNAFSQLVSSELKTDNVNLLKCVRLGKKPIDSKARPLLISVAKASTKYSILKRASKLRHSSSYNKVKGRQPRNQIRLSVSPDKTLKEREAAKELHVELKRCLSAGEKHLTIRRGKIVTVVPQVAQTRSTDTAADSINNVDKNSLPSTLFRFKLLYSSNCMCYDCLLLLLLLLFCFFGLVPWTYQTLVCLSSRTNK